ncbi:MAG: helix-turn-helix domain-containing protein [Opitutus sp.]|nr:helix-turn-helix domain-containing protein [Opitutus sp.]
MQTIGERLEEARKKKGISIREAAEATKIRGDYLQKFENNQFDINLTDLYVRGFLRSYANFLKIPSDRLLNDYAALGRGEGRVRQPSREVYGRMDLSIASAEERNDAPQAETPAPSSAQPARKSPQVSRGPGAGLGGLGIDPALVFKAGKWIGVAALVLIVLWGAKAIFSGSSSETAATKTTAPSSLVQSATEPTINLVALDTVRVKVVAVADGRILLPDTTLTRGQVQPVPKPGPIYITYSAGKNLQVEVAGKRYPMPTEGYDRAQIK